MKTLPDVVKTVKEIDNNSAINESMLSELVKNGCLPYEKHGNRTVIELDRSVESLNKMLGLEKINSLPHIRTIRNAVKYLKDCKNECGILEEQVRLAVNNDMVDCIRIGNRAYIALEQFEEPYVKRFTQIDFSIENKNNDQSAADQLGQILADAQGVPLVKRIRKTA